MITLLKVGATYNSPDHKTFLIDSSADVASLPSTADCAPGSMAYTPDLKTIYIFGNDGAWHSASE